MEPYAATTDDGGGPLNVDAESPADDLMTSADAEHWDRAPANELDLLVVQRIPDRHVGAGQDNRVNRRPDVRYRADGNDRDRPSVVDEQPPDQRRRTAAVVDHERIVAHPACTVPSPMNRTDPSIVSVPPPHVTWIVPPGCRTVHCAESTPVRRPATTAAAAAPVAQPSVRPSPRSHGSTSMRSLAMTCVNITFVPPAQARSAAGPAAVRSTSASEVNTTRCGAPSST